MRRAGIVDNSQSDIVKALRSAGIAVQSLAAVGKGVPDLLVSLRGVNVLLECKTGTRECDRKLTQMEDEWLNSWPGAWAVVSTPDEAVDAVLRACGLLGKEGR